MRQGRGVGRRRLGNEWGETKTPRFIRGVRRVSGMIPDQVAENLRKGIGELKISDASLIT